MPICNKCKENKPKEDFYPEKTTRGFRYKCKECESLESKKYREEVLKYRNPDKIDYPEYKLCTKCNKTKHKSEFNKAKENKSGLRPHCKSCLSERRKEYREKNKEWENQKSKEYANKNKEYTKEQSRKNYYKHHKHKLEKQREYKKKNNYAEKSRITRNLPVYFNDNNKTFIKEVKKYEKTREGENGYLEVTCAYCGEFFAPKYYTIFRRVRAIDGRANTEGTENRMYCSDECKKACPTYKQQKEPKKPKQETSREVQPELRQMVFQRDNYTCQKCGTHKNELYKPIHCHHIYPLTEDPVQSSDTENCITLCSECHKKSHRIPGCSAGETRCSEIV